MENLLNKVVLITGASSGIGGYTAKFLSKFKPKLALVARSADRLNKVQEECEMAGCGEGNVITVTADLAIQEELPRIISETVDAFGQIDTLVNNAAAFALSDVEHTKSDTFDRLIAVNLCAPFFLSQHAMPHLKKTKGSVINISSMAAHRPIPDVAAYCISKRGLEHFTKLLALEMAGHGVRANAVIPGGTMTDTDEEWLQLGLPDLSMQLSEVERTQPLGGSCSMQDIASVIGFLASDLANAMTGACLPVDRGALVMPSIQPQVVSEQMVEMKNMGDFNIVPTELRLQQLAELIKAGAHGPSSSSL